MRDPGLRKQLEQEHEVDAVAVGTPADEAALAGLARRSVVVRPRCARSAPRRLAEMLRGDRPDIVNRLWSPEFMRVVQCLVADGGYDAVQAEGIEMGRYLCVVPPDRRIYAAHNAEFLLQRR